MAREDNLKHFTSEQSREKAVENGRKGGIASGEAKRKRRDLRLQFELLLVNRFLSGCVSYNLECFGISL